MPLTLSSRDDSENSQGDEQFRARRDFLKSGLPESFKKQIAKTVATNEAYAVSCSSFQPVVHVLQMSQGVCFLLAISVPSIQVYLLVFIKHKGCNTLMFRFFEWPFLLT